MVSRRFSDLRIGAENLPDTLKRSKRRLRTCPGNAVRRLSPALPKLPERLILLIMSESSSSTVTERNDRKLP